MKRMTMKKVITLLVAFFAIAISANAQGIIDSTARHPYYKDTFNIEVKADFEKTWNACKDIIAEYGGNLVVNRSSQDDEGKFKGSLKSDAIILVQGIDSTLSVLQRYEYDMVYIPNSQWTIGRVIYRVVMKEIDENTTNLTLFVQLSGKEDKITQIFHFFKSNGILENRFFDKLHEKLKK